MRGEKEKYKDKSKNNMTFIRGKKSKNWNGFKNGNHPKSEFKKGEMQFEKSYSWKGDKAGKDAMHKWVEIWKGKPAICEMCGITTAKKYEWANINHQYRRVLEDYIRVCTSCHRIFDYKNNQYKRNLKKYDPLPESDMSGATEGDR